MHLSEAVMDIAQLSLPDDFTLKFDPQIHQIRWRVGALAFGKRVVIDLSAPPMTLPSGASAPPAEGQASWGQTGASGAPGGSGFTGLAGRLLSLKIKTHLSMTTGSLWIKTDSGPGSSGGSGGQGQLGGGSTCGSRTEGPRSHGGNGGPGGPGGAGGWGGMTSMVIVSIDNYPVGYELRPSACSAACGSSSRPPGADGDDGKIVIWGSPGCGGSGGPGGKGGGGGDAHREARVCREFPINNYSMGGGAPGPSGPKGAQGANGACGIAVLRGPQAPPPEIPPNASEKEKCELGVQASCVAYASQLQATCARAYPFDPTAPPARIAATQDALIACIQNAECVERRGYMLGLVAKYCGTGPEADPFRCEVSRRDIAITSLQCISAH